MYWNTGIVQDRDGCRLEVDIGSSFNLEHTGLFACSEDAKVAELARRLKMSLDHGPSSD
jgi:hypothetical protein